jgi:hypothetical protein
MLSRELIELALTLTERSDVILGATGRLDEDQLQHYWVASRSLLNTWAAALRDCADQMEATRFAAGPVWAHWTPLFEEILASELVTRVWACLLEACDHRLGLVEYSPIGRSALAGHLDVRCRVLSMICLARPPALAAVGRVNRTRLRLERWTDMLLASLGGSVYTGSYCFDRQRVRQLEDRGDGDRSLPVAPLRAACLADDNQWTSIAAGHARLHGNSRAAILGSLGPELFHATGPMMAGWELRLLTLTADAQRWVEHSAETEDHPPQRLAGRLDFLDRDN